MQKGLRLMLILLAAIIVISVVVLWSQVQKLLGFNFIGQQYGHITANIRMIGQGLGSYNSNSSFAEYGILNYTTTNATDGNESIAVYSKDPLPPIYLLGTNNYCVDCFDQQALYKALSASLKTYGLLPNGRNLNLIDITNAYTIPKGSVVIIASGLIPEALLPNSTESPTCPKFPKTDLVNMANQGDTIIYIGQNFNKSATCTSQVAETTENQIALLENVSINTVATSPLQGLNASNENESNNVSAITSPLYFKSPTFFFIQGQNYSNATSIASGNGTMVALSNFPTTGWPDSTRLARDIAKAIDSRFYLQSVMLGSGMDNITVNNRTHSTAVITANTILNNANIRDELNSAYSIISVKLSNNNNYYEQNIPFRVGFTSNSTINIPAAVGVSQTVSISAVTAGLIPGQQGSFILNIYRANSSRPVQTIFIGTLINFQVIYKQPTFSLQSGWYRAELVNTDGRSFAKSLFYVANITIIPSLIDFHNGTFIFNVTSNNRSLNRIGYSVSMNGAYSQGGTINNGTISYILPKYSIIGYGNKTFNFTILGQTIPVEQPYANPGIPVPPILIEFAIAAIFIAVLNRILVAPNTDEYYINVPDFASTKRMVVKEHADTILNVFDQVNFYYHWKHMPLTAEEVKAGISNNMRYGNMPISITLQNTFAVLNRLTDKGLLASVDDYYVPKKWAEESGHDIEYLVIFRRLRDHCVANAVLFTELDKSEAADAVITSKGVQSSVFIYTDSKKMKDLKLDYNDRVYILFLNEEMRMEFVDKLYQTYGQSAEVLKVGIGDGVIKLVDSYNLAELGS